MWMTSFSVYISLIISAPSFQFPVHDDWLLSVTITSFLLVPLSAIQTLAICTTCRWRMLLWGGLLDSNRYSIQHSHHRALYEGEYG